MDNIQTYKVVDDTTFETVISLDETGAVESISNLYFDENSDHHRETITYCENPFADVTGNVDSQMVCNKTEA